MSDGSPVHTLDVKHDQNLANPRLTSESPPPSATSITNPRGAGTKRKRGVVPSSRSVAALTPDQLEKKRKNDREVRIPPCPILDTVHLCHYTAYTTIFILVLSLPTPLSVPLLLAISSPSPDHTAEFLLNRLNAQSESVQRHILIDSMTEFAITSNPMLSKSSRMPNYRRRPSRTRMPNSKEK
jgi:hypothetical protein